MVSVSIAMARTKPLVVIGLLGPTLDTGTREARWERWRPSVSVCQHADLPVARFELLHQPMYTGLARTIQRDIATVSPATVVNLVPFEMRDPWDFEEIYGSLADVARRYAFDPEREDYLVHITTGTHVAQICLFLLTESRHFPARLLQMSPPPRGTADRDIAGTWRVIDLDLSRYDRLATRFAQEARERTGVLKAGIDTRNAAFNALIDRIERVALASRAPILLTGPTGAGKTQLAKRIYALKRARRQVSGPFVEVNCATLRGDAAMATLFGHVKGAFTGAVAAREGLLRQADGGVAFLDEIAELGLDEQAMLLRALEEKTFRPMGSDREVKSDFQLLAGTHRDLAARVAEGRFREDLLARIELWTFRLPGLRERPEDIEANLEFELEQNTRTLGVRVTFNREARERFVAFATSADAAWRGNFRDFGAAVTRMATLAQGGRIDMATVEDELTRLSARGGGGMITVDEMQALQTDTKSLVADQILPVLDDAYAHVPTDPMLASYRGRADLDALVAMLHAWDHHMDMDASEPVAYEGFQMFLTKEILADDLPLAFNPILGQEPIYLIKWAVRAVTRSYPNAENLMQGGRDVVVLRALADTAAWLTTRFGGTDPSMYRWSDFHGTHFGGWISALDGGWHPTNGGEGTVNVSSTVFFDSHDMPNAQLEAHSGPIYRYVTQFAADGVPETVVTIPRGESGDPASPHYADTMDDWIAGRYRPLLFRSAEVAADMESTETLAVGTH